MWELFGYHISNDIYHGIFGQWKKYSIGIAVMILICLQFLPMLEFVRLTDGPPVSFGDYLFHVFKGMAIIDSNDMSRDINVFWIIYNFIISFIVSYYPFKDLNGYGQQILIRSQKRSYWWVSKCVWTFLCVLIYYLLTYFTISIFVLISGGTFDLIPQYSIQGVDAVVLNIGVIVLIGIVLPMLTSLCFSLLQLLLSLIFKPILSIMIILALMTFSIFICTDWSIGNYTMVARSVYLTENGVDPTNGLIIMSVISVLSIITGLVIFKRKDIFSN